MNTSEESLFHELEAVERVVDREVKFKAKLKIGDDAYASIRNGKVVQRLWDVGGAAATGAGVAASGPVAAIFFAGGGILAKAGVTLGLASTPVGWVIASAILSGGAYCGIMYLCKKHYGARVDVVPKFINSPIDLLGADLFDMLAGLALKIAASSGGVEESERRSIINHFVGEWGIFADYAEKALPLIERNLDKSTIKERIGAMMEFQLENPDCNPEEMKREIMELLSEVAHADGRLDEQEEITLELIGREMGIHLSLHRRFGRSMKRMARGAWSKIKPSKATSPTTEE